jgi:tetratricopeptide (TPR) repeat protein
VWQLAALSVAQRAEDTQFLIGFTELAADAATTPDSTPTPTPTPTPAGAPAPSPTPPPALLRGRFTQAAPFPDEVANVQKEIGHLNHVVARFPREKRFLLGEALARERPSPQEALKLYSSLLNDLDVGAEANVRLGALLLRQGQAGKAIEQFDRAEWLTRDPDLIYLARFLRGQIAVKARNTTDAIAAFRAALAVRPGSQSASTALATLLVKADQHTAARTVMKAALDAGSDYQDPYIEYMHGDDRFWPLLIEKLHREITAKPAKAAKPATGRSGAEPERGWGPATQR